MTLFRGCFGPCIFGKIFPKNNRAKFGEKYRNAGGCRARMLLQRKARRSELLPAAAAAV
jgi:hypothetical protein